MKYLIILIFFVGCSTVDNHLISMKPQLYSPWGGGNDNNGITWQIKGNFYAYPGENIDKLEQKYAKWYPSINSKSMVAKGYGVPIPPGKNVVINWKKQYERLIKRSKIKYVNVNGQIMVTREEI